MSFYLIKALCPVHKKPIKNSFLKIVGFVFLFFTPRAGCVGRAHDRRGHGSLLTARSSESHAAGKRVDDSESDQYERLDRGVLARRVAAGEGVGT